MSVIKLGAAEVKPDLVVEYKGKEYVLPGTVNADFLEYTVASKESSAFFQAFIKCIIPDDFKKVLPEQDMANLVEIWAEYVSAPKDSSSNE